MGHKLNAPFWQAFSIPNPALGAELVFSNPGDFVSRTISAAFVLTTSAVVAARGVSIAIGDGSVDFFRAGSSFTQPANTSYTYGLNSGGADFGDASTVCHLPLPANGLVILPGWVARTVTANLQAGDQFSQVGALIESFPNGPGREWLPTMDYLILERS